MKFSWKSVGLVSILLLMLSIFLGYLYYLKNSVQLIEAVEEDSALSR